MTLELTERITRLEYRVDGHEKHIDVLGAEGSALTKSLEKMERTLLQIKWLALGATASFAANQLGLEKIVKLVFGGA